MFLLSDTVRTVCGHLREGRSVRIIAAPGSGRSDVLAHVMQQLEAGGHDVLFARGDAVAPGSPGYGLEQFGIAGAPRSTPATALALVDALAQRVGSARKPVIALDDASQLDHLTLKVISAVRERLRTPITRVERVGESVTDVLAPIWPEVVVRIPPLAFEQVGDLLRSELGALADPNVVARVLSSSGGSPQLVLAIVQSARQNGLVALEGDRWQSEALTLWSDDLVPLVAHLMTGTSDSERYALQWLAAAGPCTLEAAADEVGTETIQHLSDRELVSISYADAGLVLVHVWPPIVADYFLHGPASVAALLEPASDGQGLEGSGHTPGELGFRAPGAQTGREAVAVARLFHDLAVRTNPRLFAAWRTEPTPRNALAYLYKARGHSAESPRMTQVFENTGLNAVTDSDDFFYAFLRAEWLAIERRDPEQATMFLDGLASRSPGWAEQLTAADIIAHALVDPVPDDAEERLAFDPRTDQTGLGALALALVRLIVGDVNGSQDALRSGERNELVRRTASYLGPLQRLLEGEVSEATRDALEARAVAAERVDQQAYVGASYVAALGLIHLGAVEQAEIVVRTALGLGQPGLLMRPIFGALVNLGATLGAETGEMAGVSPFLRDYAGLAPEPGPLAWIGGDVPRVLELAESAPDRFDEELASAIDDRRGRGYRTAALQTAVLGLAAAPGPRIVERVDELIRVADVPAYRNAARLADLVLDPVPEQLERWLRDYAAGDDAHLIALILSACAHRAERRGDSATAGKVRRLADSLVERTPHGVSRPAGITRRRLAQLTGRERQVGALAETLSNTEIAERLGLSVRTVENHITNALRKTSLGSRHELAALIADEQ